MDTWPRRGTSDRVFSSGAARHLQLRAGHHPACKAHREFGPAGSHPAWRFDTFPDNYPEKLACDSASKETILGIYVTFTGRLLIAPRMTARISSRSWPTKGSRGARITSEPR